MGLIGRKVRRGEGLAMGLNVRWWFLGLVVWRWRNDAKTVLDGVNLGNAAILGVLDVEAREEGTIAICIFVCLLRVCQVQQGAKSMVFRLAQATGPSCFQA